MESSFNLEPMRLHGCKLVDYAIEHIDEALEAVEHLTIEHSLGQAVLSGTMSAEEARECLEAYERTFNTSIES